MDKKDQRIICLQNRNKLSKSEQTIASKTICDTLSSFIKKDKVLSYMPLKNEVDVTAFNILKETAYPYVDGDNLLFYKANSFIEGSFHIKEPDIKKSTLVDIDDYSYILVPLVGFDERCHRLGRGKGYYDRFLKNKNLIKIGIAFEIQKQDKIICDNNDIDLDYVITEKQIYINLGRKPADL